MELTGFDLLSLHSQAIPFVLFAFSLVGSYKIIIGLFQVFKFFDALHARYDFAKFAVQCQ